ncbi:polysaccharide biosynthesis/export family protein [Pseudoteredinibacter isoporae]|uniref:Protein involved in polysaccharide export with SLBB domain n=1 Tax=Pseudoteredinibacter isoporae TaxID=570281 RepID=A0A7X0JVJ9_9GAMM|nr:polysaccharide biosynthesis/export family protein [Pseudoteredinibacter isoporae]MBB6523063.1 protein involved in polysaccharide export with SLBB domain [Pseudoteredinibacter isoporae]NHO88583.1 polysaccharide export protein [Pseudoteredinibacter isoporae]NIB22726.1 polysaccharide export protein [Pseudoteredinibacter isoporae]
MIFNRTLTTAILLVLMNGCTQHHGLGLPDNSDTKDQRAFLYGSQVDIPNGEFGPEPQCTARQHSSKSLSARPLPLSPVLGPGDLLEIDIGIDKALSGHFIIADDGHLHLAMLPPVLAAGQSTQQLAQKLELALIKQGIYKAHALMLDVRVLQWAAIDITVQGSVFAPGRVRINTKTKDSITESELLARGDYAPLRYLSEALRAASGVRPDADLSNVQLKRGGWTYSVNVAGIVSGHSYEDIPLLAGDKVWVPSTGCMQEYLIRPSMITPKGMRVFLSNLSETASNNSNAAVGRYSSNLPYGSRLLHAAASANCMGGASLSNASRRIILATRNPFTGKTQVVERSIEELLRHPDRDILNPYLMPNDAIACYDSDISNARSLARSLLDILSPIKLL